MDLFLLGFSFQKTPLEIRENLYFRETELQSAYQQAKEQFHLDNLVIVSTCNRIELYFSSKSKNSQRQISQKLLQFVAHFHKQNISICKKYAYLKKNIQVVRHLYTVISSLDSMVVGENQILAQIKVAYYFRQINDLLLNRLFQSAIALGKKIRSKTKIGAGGVSIGSLSIDIVKNLFNQNDEFSICLLGSGIIAQECLHSLQTYGNAQVVICNRDLEKAKNILKKLKTKKSQHKKNNYQVVSFDSRYEAITNSDITICSTDADVFIIEQEKLRQEFIEKTNKIHLLIDLSVPRNIDPRVHNIKQVIYYSIDDLQQITKENKEKRLAEITLVDEIINESINDFLQWQIKTLFFEFLKKQKSFPTNEETKKHHQINLTITDKINLKKNYYSLFNNFLQKQTDVILPQFYLNIDHYWGKVSKVIDKKN